MQQQKDFSRIRKLTKKLLIEYKRQSKTIEEISKETNISKSIIYDAMRYYKLLEREKKIRNRYTICKHHKDLDRDNNSDDNISLLTNREHGLIHAKAYRYLVETGHIQDYLDWFNKKYKAWEVK